MVNPIVTITDADIIKLEERFEEKFMTKKEWRSLENNILQMKDEIMSELKSMREEFAMLTYRNSQHSDKLENHESRITTIEDKIAF